MKYILIFLYCWIRLLFIIILLGNLVCERIIKYSISLIFLLWDFKYRKYQHFFLDYYSLIIPFFALFYFSWKYKTLSDYFLSKNAKYKVVGLLINIDDLD